MMRNIKLIIEYDGTNYHGWQEQKDKLTIQQVIKECIIKLTKEKNIKLIGAGRTDAGVHAKAQVANFLTNSKIPEYAFCKALNSILPKDIAILKSEEVDLNFHSQFDAKAKAYSYNIFHRDVRPALQERYFHWIFHDLNIEYMKKASKYLIGTHDFSSFQSSNSPRKSTIRTINYIDIQKNDCYIKILIEANGFLYKMVRNIVGTLIEIGQEKRDFMEMKKILEGKNRKLAGPTAPAKGLVLEYVKY